MIGAILGAATSVAGGIIAGNQASKARKRAARILDDQKRRETALYNKDYNQDYTQTASAQNALRKARELADGYINRAEGAKAVMGGTDESVANTKAKANEAIANTTSDIASEGQNRADKAEDRYDKAMTAVENAQANYEQQTANNIAKAGSEVMKAGINMASNDVQSWDDMFGLTKDRKKKSNE